MESLSAGILSNMHCYTNAELAVMHFMHGAVQENAASTQRNNGFNEHAKILGQKSAGSSNI